MKNSTATSFAPGTSSTRGRLVAVEGEIGVGEVVDEVESVLPGQFDKPRQKRQVDALGCRVRREVDDERLGPRRHARNQVLKLREELFAVGDRVR